MLLSIWIPVIMMLCFQEMKSATGIPSNDTQSQELEAARIFHKECAPSYCSANGPVVKFPLHLKGKPNICGKRNMALSCSGNTTVIDLFSGTYNVTRILYDYPNPEVYVAIQPFGSTCLRPDNIPLPILSGSPFFYDNNVYTTHVWFNCSTKLSPDDNYYFMGPISCLSEHGNFVYLAMDLGINGNKFQNCTKFADASNLAWPFLSYPDVLEAVLILKTNGIPGDCSACTWPDDECGLWLAKNKTLCYNPRPSIMYQNHSNSSRIRRIALGIGIAVGIILIIGAPVFFLMYQKHRKTKEVRRKVEQFIKGFNATNPTRYSYNDIIKITKRFKTKIGQGGFGGVFKGMLPNGIPVAVKILQYSAGNGEEFINEVSTIGRIHHVNVVRLVGFCSEGTRRALVYELMENGSLDKYIFYKQIGQVRQRRFNLEVLQNMVISIAEGIEYLHQGCNQRILHLDIKPHNILLDHNFNPKISDFGLSKICPKDQSYVTVSAARGTLSYMAPEMYSRNFGTVSYKSDLYSFGMLILEMVSGRRNSDPLTGNQSDVYFPELIHEQLIQGEDLEMILDTQSNDAIAKKLVTVALWCIQWNPRDRPTMSRVVNMLKGDVESMEVPPKSSISSMNQHGLVTRVK